MDLRMPRFVTITIVAGSLMAAVTPAWAPEVGRPPAPGYPNCTKVGDDGPNTIRGTNRRDVICADEGNDTVFGLGGNDFLFGGPGVDRMYGGPGNDEFHGWTQNDKLFGDEGDDRINGEIGNDLIVGGLGADELLGAGGNDCLFATDGAGGDVLKGMLGDDRYEADAQDVVKGSTEREAECYKEPSPIPSPTPSPTPTPTASPVAA